MDVYRPRKVSDEEIRGELMNKLHRLGMIWLKIGQKSQGYTNTGTRRRPGETWWRIRNKEREHLGFKTLGGDRGCGQRQDQDQWPHTAQAE